MFSLKSSYCGKIFMSIQVVLNVWEQFKVQNLDIFGLQWTLGSSFLLHTMSISNNFFEKVAHTSLVCVIKVSYQSNM